MRKAILSILLLCTAVSLQAQTVGRNACWLNAATGAWEWGFFKDFAVHDARQWQYVSVKEGRKKTAVTLRNGKETLQLEIQTQGDSACTIAIDGGKPQHYVRLKDNRLAILSRMQPDSRPSPPCTFREDSVTLRGYLPGKPHHSVSCYYRNMLELNNNTMAVQTDSAGVFEMRFPLGGRSQAILETNPGGMPLILSPGKEYFFMRQGGPLLMEQNTRINLEQLTLGMDFKVNNWNFPETAMTNDSLYLLAVHQELDRQQHRLDSIYDCYPNLSQDSRSFNLETLLYSTLQSLIQLYYKAAESERKSFSPGITHLMDSLVKALPPVPTALDDNSTYFAMIYPQYLNLLAYSHGHVICDMKQLKRALSEQKDLQVPDSLIQLVNRTIYMEKAIQKAHHTDTAFRATYHQNHTDILQALEKLPDASSVKQVHRVRKLREHWEVLNADTLLSETQKDYARTLLATMAMEESCTPLPDNVFREALACIQTPGLRETVTRRQEFYVHQQQTPFDYQNSLKDNDAIEGLTDGNEILQRILAPYRGKVVYTDIWGSWCTPCKRDMKYFVPAIKEAMKGRDVVFLYFAKYTTDASWKQIIREYHSVGAQTVHYNLPEVQQEAVEGILLNGGYPSYAIFDKEGRLVTKNAPRPNEKDKLIQTLEEQLSKK